MEEIRADERSEHAGDERDRRSLVRNQQQSAHRGNQSGKQAWHRNADSLDRFRHPITEHRVDDNRQE